MRPRVAASTEVMAGDLLDPSSLERALEGIDVAYYLVHSMGTGGDYRETDRRAARLFGEAARRRGVRRIVYLGGLANRDGDLSKHLRSRIETGDGAGLTPETLFLATGKHDLRGIGRPRDRPEAQTIGIRVRLAPNPALDRLIGGTIELHLFDRGYCGLVLQEGGRGNLCLAVRKSRLTEAGGDPDRLLAEWGGESPAFAERLAFREGGSDAVGAIPYGWIAREALPGVFRLGDQGAVIPSLSGEGNGVALASGIIAARSWLAGEASETFQPRLARAAARPVTIAQALWHWAERPNTAQLMTRGVRLAPWLAGRFAEWTRVRH